MSYGYLIIVTSNSTENKCNKSIKKTINDTRYASKGNCNSRETQGEQFMYIWININKTEHFYDCDQRSGRYTNLKI